MNQKIRPRTVSCATALLLAVATPHAAWAAPAPAPSGSAPSAAGAIEQRHAQAVQAFQSGRFSAAYGNFIALAKGGHGASAQYALWMCEHGLALFGQAWDCAPHQVEAWLRAAGERAR